MPFFGFHVWQMFLEMFGKYEFLPNKELFTLFAQDSCRRKTIDLICENVLFLLGGYDSAQLNVVSCTFCYVWLSIDLLYASYFSIDLICQHTQVGNEFLNQQMTWLQSNYVDTLFLICTLHCIQKWPMKANERWKCYSFYTINIKYLIIWISLLTHVLAINDL